MSKATAFANRQHAGYVDLKNLTPREYELVKDGLAALLAALPTGHTLRTEVTDLIKALKENS